MTLRVRQAMPQDAPTVAEIYVQSRRVGWSELLDSQYLDSLDVADEGSELWSVLAPAEAGWRILVAEEGGRLVGFVSIGPDADGGPTDGHLGALFVDPERFGSGIGTALLEAAEDQLRALGFASAVLWTLQDDPDLMRFYEARGWTQDGSTMTLELDRPRLVVRCRKSWVSR